jgi:tripartite-type tricarboxylate transporter receptor subunit TctC
MFIAVAPSFGISTLPELIARAKKAPGEITYATTGVGRLTHLTGELLQREAGIKLLVVPYTGGPSHAVTDVATGRVAIIIEGYSGVAGATRSGSIKLIAVASAKRLAEFPDVPTVAETIPGFQATGWAVLVAPIGTSESIIDKISEDLRKVTLDPELQKKLAPLGSYTIRCRPPRPPPSFTSSSRRGNRSSTGLPKTSAEGGTSPPAHHAMDCRNWATLPGAGRR